MNKHVRLYPSQLSILTYIFHKYTALYQYEFENLVKIKIASKFFLANFTNIWFLSRMNKLMPL